MHSYKTVIIISFLIVGIFGVIPSIYYCEWIWFSRSGSLLVIFAMFVIWQDYQGSIRNDLNILYDGFEEYLEKNSDIQNEKQSKRISKNIKNKFDEVDNLTKKRFQNIEFFIVALGTLIWGYGDLLNKIYE